MSQKVEKVHNFLDPSLPQDVLDFFECGKIGNLMTPPLGPYLGKIWNWENFEFWEPPPLRRKNISLKHSKFPKNHFKTNLFFVQRKHLKSTFTFGKNKNIASPTSYQKVQILDFLIFCADPSPSFWTFSIFCDISLFEGSPY